MNRESNKNQRFGPPASFTLRRARIRFALRPRVILGGVSAVFTGPRSRSVRFTFMPKRRNVAHGIEAIEFELSRVEAWSLAEWMTAKSTKHTQAPKEPAKR